MALTLFDDRSRTVSGRHVEAKPNGSFQYRRRIPVCLQGHYPGKAFFVRSLGRDAHALARKAADLMAELDKRWAQLRAVASAEKATGNEAVPEAGEETVAAPTALQVLVDYLSSARAQKPPRGTTPVQVFRRLKLLGPFSATPSISKMLLSCTSRTMRRVR